MFEWSRALGWREAQSFQLFTAPTYIEVAILEHHALIARRSG